MLSQICGSTHSVESSVTLGGNLPRLAVRHPPARNVQLDTMDSSTNSSCLLISKQAANYSVVKWNVIYVTYQTTLYTNHHIHTRAWRDSCVLEIQRFYSFGLLGFDQEYGCSCLRNPPRLRIKSSAPSGPRLPYLYGSG